MNIMITIGITISWYPSYIIRKSVAMDLPKISARITVLMYMFILLKNALLFVVCSPQLKFTRSRFPDPFLLRGRLAS